MGHNNYKVYLEVAVQIAVRAGRLLQKNFDSPRKVEYKGEIDLVTEMDRRSEELIIGEIEKKFPGHAVLTEEEGSREKDSEYRWIIDPLDGTVNYTHRFGFYAVSIALQKEGEGIVAAVVNAPYLRETYTAFKGGGAQVNGREARVSSTDELDKSMLATGFPYDIRESGSNIEYFNRFLVKSRAVRRPGSAAIDLCSVASGKFDGFWELKLSPWDVAAGTLIVTEAGGKVTDFKGGPVDIYGDQILSSNGKIHSEMIEVLNNEK